jgi:hypothetical protein
MSSKFTRINEFLLALNVVLIGLVSLFYFNKEEPNEFTDKMNKGGVMLTGQATANNGHSYIVKIALAPDEEEGVRIVGMQLHDVTDKLPSTSE